ncbi:MAG: GNAT family N-acetyltransferase [Acidimicrobiia bacterium]
MVDPEITFAALTLDDLALIRRWLNTPHVYEWWGVSSGPDSLGGPGDDAASEEQVYEKYAPGVDPEAAGTQRYIITIDGRPVGLIQWYALADEPDYAAKIGEAASGGAGIDLFIGETDSVDRGLGPAVLDQFVVEIVFADATITRAIGAPHSDNARSCRAFEKAGFVFARDVMVEDGSERVHVRHR